MSIKIALAGNPNSGKTTLFNALTGSNQFVGNWPGVTVEKKEGRLKSHKDVTIVDLPGIYSLSPYTLEEVVARSFLTAERPDAILNIVDGTNLERNLYLTTQLIELGLPMVVAVNMMDVVQKNGDKIYIDQLSQELGCPMMEISALKGKGIKEAADKAVEVAKRALPTKHQHAFRGCVEHALAHIEEAAGDHIPASQQRWFAIKLFERDEKVLAQLNLPGDLLAHIEEDIQSCEAEMDDDAESIITNERYLYIASIIHGCYHKKNKGGLTISDKIDRVVTNRILALPIFALVMVLVYYISVSTVGGWATDWANDGLFGDGWHLPGNGAATYEEAVGEFDRAFVILEAFEEAAKETGMDAKSATGLTATAYLLDDAGNVEEVIPVTFADYEQALGAKEPDPADFGIWVPGVPVLVSNALESVNAAPWLHGLIVDGIVGGVGAVLGFVPQMLILFLFLAFLEGCGYMARIAFIMDRIFRKFGLSGKSFIPILIGTGCGVPGIMASRTIEDERDRRMTIMTTTFIPCSAKLPIIALISGALFGGAWWVAPSAYFVGMAAILASGIILKKTKLFAGDPAPFVMELPAYHWPTPSNVLRSMWERGWSFIKKAGTIILLSTILVWFASNFGIVDGRFTLVEDLSDGFLSAAGGALAPAFAPLGWGDWRAAVAAITGLVAKENVVGTFGILYGFAEVAETGVEIWSQLAAGFTTLSAYSFLVFNLLCAPCFAAIGAIRREMNNARWTWFAIGYQTALAYAVSLCIYQLGMLITTGAFGIGTAAAFAVLAAFLYLLFRPYREDASPAPSVKAQAKAQS
ncbi:MAG: ferrous iron transporter B [Christensenellales bacterium]|jgi:ferrous iron transport protein B